MGRLRLVAARGQRVERSSAQEAHAVLRVADGVAGEQVEEKARRPVREPPLPRHRLDVREAVSDHELRVARRGNEGRDCRGGVLAVGVDHDHGVRAAAHVLDPGPDGGALAAALWETDELEVELLRQSVELRGDGGV